MMVWAPAWIGWASAIAGVVDKIWSCLTEGYRIGLYAVETIKNFA